MNLFSYIKTRVTILDVVSEYATLKKAGLYWKGPCPFHSEKTASFTVSPHKEIFYCFGCQKGGDVITFVAEVERCSPIDAAKQLVERYNIDLPTTLALTNQNKEEKKHYQDLCQVVGTWCHERLLQSREAVTYLLQRGITKESIIKFQLGYFPGGLSNIRHFIDHLGKHHILINDLLAVNILSKGKNIYFSPFEERIIFPISDQLGQPCGFGGRTFKPTDTRPKYYNSHENEHFVKGSLLFGLHTAKKEIQKKEQLFLVEGYMDAIAMVQHGYGNTVATLGTACSLEHLQQLARYAQQLFVLYDADKAGVNAILRIAELAWHANIELKVVCLPSGEDPASFLTNKNDIAPLIDQAKDIFSFFIDTLGKGFSTKTLYEKLSLTRKIVDIVLKIEDPLKQELLLQQASQVLGIPLTSLKRELRAGQSQQKPVAKAAPEAPKIAKLPENHITPLERKIFSCIMNNMQLLNKENGDFLITYLPTPLCDILSKLCESKSQQQGLGFIQFFEQLDIYEQQLVSKISLENTDDMRPDYFEQLMIQFQKKHWKVIVNNTKISLEAAKEVGNEQEVTKIMHDFMTLKKKILAKST